MTRNNFYSAFCALIIAAASFFAAGSAQAQAQRGFTKEQKDSIINELQNAFNEIQNLAGQYAPGADSFLKKKITLEPTEEGFNSVGIFKFQNNGKTAWLAGEQLANRPYAKGWDEYVVHKGTRKICEKHQVSCPTIKTGWRQNWNGIKDAINAYMPLVKNQQPLNQALKEAQQLESLQDQMEAAWGKIYNLVMGLEHADSVSVICNIPVPEDGECPPENLVYIITDKNGNATSGAAKGCMPLPLKYAEIQSCLLCPLFNVILRTDQTMATKSYSALAGSFRNVIIVVLALFIAYHTLLTVSAFTKQDAPKYITTLLVQSFKVLLAALLLSNSTYIYQYAINPLMETGLEFGLALLFRDNPAYGNVSLLAEFEMLTKEYAPTMPTGAIGQELLGSVMAAIQLFNKAAAQMPAIGSSLICISVHEAAWKGVIPQFSMLIEGALVYAFGWAIVLASCFYLLDSVVRFGIFCALLPFLIASWPFKVTARYAKTGWDIFMNAFFNFVMMGLIISINSELISQALSGGKGGMDALEAAINGSEVDALKELMDISGVDFLVLVACCMFAFKLVGQVNQLATEMAGGGGSSGIGNKIGGTAAQAAKKVGGIAAKGGKAVAGTVYEGTGAKASVQGVKDKYKGKLASAGAKIGLGPKANPNGADTPTPKTSSSKEADTADSDNEGTTSSDD